MSFAAVYSLFCGGLLLIIVVGYIYNRYFVK